ncbi:MAG TPA: hypothetical protein VGU69_06250, partial [Rhizomicrobium sp.]|nr:hypothetical protein [Rhizomicrobium sp.]
CELGDFVVVGGQAGIADHARITSGVRIAARAALAPGQAIDKPGDYGGMPAKPAREWFREMHTLTNIAKKSKRDTDG